MAFGLGTTELLIVLLIFLIIFGVGRLGTVGGGLGRIIRDFRESLHPSKNDKLNPSPADESKQ